MEKWKNFEEKVVDFIRKELIVNCDTQIKHSGGSNSHTCDAVLFNGDCKSFNIEIKFLPAQSGQFVLFPNNKSEIFEFSKNNFFKEADLPITSAIINGMNSKFNEFANPTTKCLPLLNFDSDLLSNWVKEFYLKHKKVSFFIVGNLDSLKCADKDFGNNIYIFPTENILNYLDVECGYRIKKSGTSRYNLKDIETYLNNVKCKFKTIGKKTFIDDFAELTEIEKLELKVLLENNIDRLYIGNTGELRKKSNTANANVIFSLKLKSEVRQLDSDLTKFKSAIYNI